MESISVGVHEAKTRLSDLLRRVEAGEIVIITRRGIPIAEIHAASQEQDRPVGLLADQWKLPDREGLLEALAPDPEIEQLFYGE